MHDVVGRGAVVAAIGDLLDRAVDAPTGLHLVGEPGIGKTTLLRSALEAARERGFATLVAAGGADETGLPYAVLADLLADVPPVELPDGQRAAFDAVRDAAPGPVDARAVAAATGAVLRALAPCAVVVDDLQWVDPESRAALERAVRRAAHPLAVVTATRPGPGDAALPLGMLDGPDRTTEVALGGLDPAATAALVERRLGGRVSLPTAEALHTATLGNPLLTLEIARLMASGHTGILSEADVPVPERLRRTLRLRLDALPGPARAVVDAVAVAGRADSATVAAVLPGIDVEAAVDAARELGALDISEGRLVVFHPLARAVVLAGTDDARLRDLHARLAAVVRDPFDRARHLVGAASGPDEDVARTVAEAAAEAAWRGAPGTAARLYGNAAALSTDPATATVRRARAGELWHAAGDPARAESALRDALATAPAEAASTVHGALGRILADRSGVNAGVAELRAALATATTDAQRAAAHRDLAAYVRFADGHRTALEHARAALVLARDDDLVVSCVATLALLELTTGTRPDPAMLDRGITLERRTRTRRGMASPRVVAAFVAFWTVDLDAARAATEELLAEADPREPASAIHPLYLLGLTEWRAGRWDRATEVCDRLHDTAEQCGWTDTGSHAWLRALLHAARGAHDEARAWAARARTASVTSGEPLWAMNADAVDGFCALAEGNAEVAVPLLRPAAMPYDEVAVPGTKMALPDFVEALVLTGRLAEAEEALAPYEASVREQGGPRHAAVMARCRALVLGATDVEAAIEVLAPYAGVESPEAFQLARNDLALGSLLRRARRRREAAVVLDRARAAFETLGAPVWAAKARGEADRLGRRTETPVELTPTEAAVGRLVAAGRSNKEVAAELSLSVKTVEWNLTRVYRKLGVTSRAALAARAKELLESGDSPGSPAAPGP